MLNYFYDSLETLKGVKKPTKKEVIKLTGQIFVVVIIMGIFFVSVDGLLGYLYNMIFEIIK